MCVQWKIHISNPLLLLCADYEPVSLYYYKCSQQSCGISVLYRKKQRLRELCSCLESQSWSGQIWGSGPQGAGLKALLHKLLLAKLSYRVRKRSPDVGGNQFWGLLEPMQPLLAPGLNLSQSRVLYLPNRDGTALLEGFL